MKSNRLNLADLKTKADVNGSLETPELNSEIAGHQPTLFRRQQTSDKVPENKMQADAALHALAMMMRASAGELTQDDLAELHRPSTPVIPVHSSYYHSDDSDSETASPSLQRK